MGDDREHHVGRVFLPILAEHLYRWPVIQADDGLQQGKQLRSEASPAFAQNQVVTILNANAGDFPQQVELVELFLKVEEADFPALGFEYAFQRFGSAAMTASRIKEDDCESAAHGPFPPESLAASMEQSSPHLILPGL